MKRLRARLSRDRVRKALSRALAKALPGAMARQVRAPVFVIGCGRSGTTLLANLLDHHRDIADWSEANHIWDPSGYPWSESRRETPPIWIDPAAFTARWWRDNAPRQGEIRAVFGAYCWLGREAHFLNKSPMNTFRIPYLLPMFPGARLVHIVRDGRAVAYSYARRHHERVQASPEVYRALGLDFPFEALVVRMAAFWKANVEEVARQDAALSLAAKGILLEMTYEELCADMRAALDRVCRFVGVDAARFGPALASERVANQNHKWRAALDPAAAARVVVAAEPALSQRGYT